MKAAVFKVRYGVRALFLSVLAVLIFPISFGLDSALFAFEYADPGRGTVFIHSETFDTELAGLPAKDVLFALPGQYLQKKIELTDHPIIKNERHQVDPGLDRVKSFKLIEINRSALFPGMKEFRQKLSQEFTGDFIHWQNFSINHILLTYGLIGFMSHRKKRKDIVSINS